MSITVKVTSVQPSTLLDIDGAVDAEVTITIAGETFEGAVSLAPNRGRPSVRGRHPLDAAGTPLAVWASQGVIDAIDLIHINDGDRTVLIGEIWAEVDAVARKAL